MNTKANVARDLQHGISYIDCSSMTSLPSTLVNEIKSHSAAINCLTFSAQGGTYLLSGSSDRQIHLTRTEPSSAGGSNKPLQKYTSHGYPVLDISVTSSNTNFASCSADRSGPFLWDVNTSDTTIRRFGANSASPHASRMTCLSFTAEDNVLVSGSDDRTVRIWDCRSRDTRPLMVLDDAKDGITCLQCLEKEIVTGSSDGRVRSYDIRMGKIVTETQPGVVTSLCLGRDGRTVLVGCLDGKLRVMDRENGACLRTLGDQTYHNKSLRVQSCFAVNDSMVVSGSEDDGSVKCWQVLTGKLINNLPVSESNKVVNVVKWREGSEVDGRKGVLAAGSADGTIKVYG